ncbi:delta and Notch-like epidermal growth factor-related receptor [Sinocyclocheilus rhinocerous]|uniref:delta and Notch-like epidermal growth factor-related receptor n=1 Tax=Sinocyclocheilus rhinocerous TaxID=307959 RepID=UPI0007B9C2A2|nr:PREDICTED: delta and Notch-like epidermal growth factor-related receptor [Sinocyclocheilus rhinocerous]
MAHISPTSSLGKKFFADPCASSPCLHGNCSQDGGGDGFVCECSEGYSGVRCDLPTLTFDLSESTWDLAESLVPEHATPATPATPATTTQVFQPTTVPTTTQALPTLEPWRPKPGQKVVEILWEDQQVTDEAECVSTAGGESAGMMTVSMEVAEETAVKLVGNVSGSAVLWRVSEAGYEQCSVADGTIMWFQQSSDGLVLPDQSLPFGHNYFISVLHVGAPSGPEVTLRLHLNVKTNNCMEPGSGFSDPQCSGKGKCITQSSVDTFYCQCDDGYSGIFCEEFDACHLKPCENNGTCADLTQRDEGQNYTCTCQPGVVQCVLHVGAPSGPEVTLRLHLNVKTNNCMEPGSGFSDPQCSGKGKCITQSSVDTFYCQCDDGYSGIFCEEFDACHLKPCENNGTCADLTQRDEGQNYTCTCQPGYQGVKCEQKIDPCASGPCHNNASCSPHGAGLGFSCTCPAGFTGHTCAQLVDFCALNPCAHGICRSIGTSYRCLCVPGRHPITLSCLSFFILLIFLSDLQWKMAQPVDSLTNMPRHSLYIIIGALCVAFVLMLIILIVGICRISRIEYQGSSRHAYQEFYNCRSIDSDFSNAIASIRHARFGKKSRPAMYDATPISYEDYSPDDKPLVALIKTKDL